MKKGIEISFTFIFIGLFMVVFLAFGFFIIKSFMGSTENVDVSNFVGNVKNIVNEYNRYIEGSEYVLSFSLPVKIEKICFADDINKISDPKLKLIYTNDKNMYLFPGYSYKLNDIKVKDGSICLDNFGGTLSLTFIKKQDYVEISSNDKEVECINVIYNGDPKNKVDIVFLGVNYNNNEDFGTDVQSYIDELYDVEPYSSSKTKFNFYRIDEFRDLSCRETDKIVCDEFKVKELALKCPNDFIVVLDKKSFLSMLRSTAYSNIVNLNTADTKTVLTHEFGHSIGGLGDEYVYGDFSGIEFPNCDFSPCDKWNKNGCYEGCSSSLYYRSTESSIMKDLGDNYYNKVSLDQMNNRLGVYK